jgi:hypothetical protein
MEPQKRRREYALKAATKYNVRNESSDKGLEETEKGDS